MKSTHRHILSAIARMTERIEDTSLESLIATLPYREKDTKAEVSYLAANGYIRLDASRNFYVVWTKAYHD